MHLIYSCRLLLKRFAGTTFVIALIHNQRASALPLHLSTARLQSIASVSGGVYAESVFGLTTPDGPGVLTNDAFAAWLTDARIEGRLAVKKASHN